MNQRNSSAQGNSNPVDFKILHCIALACSSVVFCSVPMISCPTYGTSLDLLSEVYLYLLAILLFISNTMKLSPNSIQTKGLQKKKKNATRGGQRCCTHSSNHISAPGLRGLGSAPLLCCLWPSLSWSRQVAPDTARYWIQQHRSYKNPVTYNYVILSVFLLSP